jgi:hypothetical protein
MNRLNIREMIKALVSFKAPTPQDVLLPQGTFMAEYVVDGRVKRVKGKNAVTTVGKNHILDVTFGNATPVTQVDPWYIGLINNSPTPTLLVGDTLASHSGWSEFASYSGNRKAWTDADASSGVKASSSVSTFTLSADGTIYGIFIASVATGTSGILWSEGAFESPITLSNGSDLKVTYSLGF